jgi:hypothetical protein
MRTGNQFFSTTERWSVLTPIYEAVHQEIFSFNQGKSDPEKLTLTSRLHSGEQFDIYAQPIGAVAALRTRVRWITHAHIAIERYVTGVPEMTPESIRLITATKAADGATTYLDEWLRDMTVHEIASEIVREGK